MMMSSDEAMMATRTPRMPATADKTGRNDPCPCGSGKKYKKCCLLMHARVPATSALESEILNIMRDWPRQLEDRLQALGLENFSGGDRLWQAKFEEELARHENIAIIVSLAEAGHVSARKALTRLLEDPKADLPSSVRAYCVRLNEGMVPSHPQDRSEVIKNMLRDLGIKAMVDVAAVRWPKQPKLYSSAGRRSLADLVAEVVTKYGIPLSERQVRRICKDRPELASRLARFLVGDPTI